MVRSWHGRSPSQAGARPVSATDAWLEAVAGDKTYVGTICELVHQVHDRACNSAAAVPIVRRALLRQDARMRQTIFWGMVRPRWWCSPAQRRGKKPYCAMRRGASHLMPKASRQPMAVFAAIRPLTAAIFEATKWRVQAFGHYAGPISMFANFRQPRMAELFQNASDGPRPRRVALQ